MATAAVHPETILKDLNGLWADLARSQAEAGGVLRACAMTLVVVASPETVDRDTAEGGDGAGQGVDTDAARARETVGLLMRDHPSRAIIIRPRGAGKAARQETLDAHVFAECWKPFGRAQQICSDGIEILPGEDGMEETARFLRPLLVPDLPLVLWFRDQTALHDDRFQPLLDLVAGQEGKAIFDSAWARDPKAALRSLKRLRASGLRVADLHWTRLTGWREAVAHLFDRDLSAGQVRSVRVGYRGRQITSCARYFEAWLKGALPRVRIAIDEVAAAEAEGESSGPVSGPEGLVSVRFDTEAGELKVAREAGAENGWLRIQGCGHDDRSLLPPITEEALMREELAILGPDPVYDRLLAQ